ncbi:MAG: HEPN domain-containing protein, partial [Elusimicrobia bacterium]|nr:HEPN domain-containing protein [Elusimicrobiota bacterium]
LTNKGPKDTICFLAEQWVEKYLKGFLTFHRKKFRFIHDLPYLIDLCTEIDQGFLKHREFSKELSDLYLALRYPIDIPPYYDIIDIVARAESIVTYAKTKIRTA